jgi:hypothetical protein
MKKIDLNLAVNTQQVTLRKKAPVTMTAKSIQLIRMDLNPKSSQSQKKRVKIGMNWKIRPEKVKK